MSDLEHTAVGASETDAAKETIIPSFLLVFVPTILLLSAIFYAFTQLSKDYELQTILIRETATLKSAGEVTSLLLEQKLSDLLVLAEGETLRKFLHDDSMKNRVHLSREFALFARRKPRYVQIRYIDAQGQEQVRINNYKRQQKIIPKGELQDKSQRYYFSRAIRLAQGEIYISPLDLNVENGEIVKPYEPTIRFATPVFDGYGEKRGIVIVNYAADELLTRLSDLFSPMHGRTMLLNPKGYWLMGAPENRLWGFMFDQTETFATQHPHVWSAMRNSEYGTFGNAEGLFVFRKTYLLDNGNLGTPENLSQAKAATSTLFDDPYWILVSQISNSMIDKLTASRATISSITYFTLFVLTGILSFLFARTAVQKKLAYQRLQESAITDELTGAANRRELNRTAKREFLRAARFQRPLAIMMLDLDHFKRVNDSFGHNVGDQVLKHITMICQSTIREQDLLVRFGGEEFVVLMPETGIEGAQQLAERICASVRKHPFHHLQHEIQITISIGISTYNEGDSDYGRILIRADNALYQAKTHGRDRVEVIPSDTHLPPRDDSPN